jgi:cytochrome P450
MSELRNRLEAEAQRGDIVTFALDGVPGVVMSHPRYFKYVLADAAAKYPKTQKDRLFGSGLLFAEGDAWTRQRRDATRLLLDVAGRQRELLETTVADLLAEWRAPGPHNIAPAVDRYVLRNLSVSLFDTDLGAHAAAFAEALRMLIRVDPRHPASMKLLAEMRDRVSQRADLPPFFANADQIVTFLLAGTETAASTLTWAMYHLAKSPDALALVRQGSEAAVTAVINETLRLYPPLWIITREAQQADTIDGVHIEAGAVVYLSVRRVQRDERFWRQPEQFRPERFLDGEQEPFTFVPFGAGGRVCVGRRFAMVELSAAIREVARAFAMTVVPGCPEPAEATHVTLRPEGSVTIAFTALEPSPAEAAPAG